VETDPSKTPWLDPQAKIKALKQSDQRVRGLAASQLGEMGADAVDALPELERLAKDDPAPDVRERAKESIDKIRAATGTGPVQK
jgi:HEAT repeat protein